MSYHHREQLQPQIFFTSNLGPKWHFEWMRYVQEVPQDPFGAQPAHVCVSRPPGGREVYAYPDAQGVFPQNWNSRATLVRVTDAPHRDQSRGILEGRRS